MDSTKSVQPYTTKSKIIQPTLESKTIQQFLKRLSPKLHVQPVVPTSKTTQILKQWVSQISEIYSRQQIPPQKPNQIETLPHFPQPPGMYWNWIPEPIRTKHIPLLKHSIQTSFPLTSSTSSTTTPQMVTLFISSTTPFPTHDFIQRIQLAVQLLSHYAPPACSHAPLHIYLYLTKAKKKKPSVRSSQVLDTIHANTAFTTSCDIHSTAPTSEPKYIVLYREEEVFKVLLHELFHALGLDFSHDSMATEKTAQFIREHFQLTLPDIRLYETYCETWATVLHCLIMAFYQTLPQPQPQSQPQKSSILEDKKRFVPAVTQTFFQLFSYEQNFVLFQCAKILHYHQLSYHQFSAGRTSPTFQGGTRKKYPLATTKKRGKKGGSSSSSSSQTRKNTPEQYRENTQIFCYYILKSAVFQNIQPFLQHFPPPFSVTESHTFAEFVQQSFLQTRFEHQLHSYTALFEDNSICNHSEPREQSICETMRQTVNEIAII